MHASAHHGALDSLDPKAYVDFLIGTMQIVTRKESWGIDWASDNQVRSRARGAEATEREPGGMQVLTTARWSAPGGMQVLTTARPSAGQAACKCSPRRPSLPTGDRRPLQDATERGPGGA